MKKIDSHCKKDKIFSISNLNIIQVEPRLLHIPNTLVDISNTKFWAKRFDPLNRTYCCSETNDTSFESPNNKLLESGKILGVASFWGWPRPLNWKSTTFTKTHVEPVMIEILPVSNLLSNGG